MRRRSLFSRRRAFSIVCAWALPAWAASTAPPLRAQGAEALALGVVPNLSPRLLAAQYQPLRNGLAQALARPVSVLTAPDFGRFHERTLAGLYELVVTAPNLGLLALDAGRAQILGVAEPGVVALAVAARGATAEAAVAALRGRHVAMANPASLVALRGLEWLRQAGLEPGRDFGIAWAPNEDSLAHGFESGATALALMSRGEYAALGEGRRSLLDVVKAFPALPGFFVMAPQRLPQPAVARLRGALDAFFASPDAAAFASGGGMRGLRALTEADRSTLAAYAAATRKALDSPAPRS